MEERRNTYLAIAITTKCNYKCFYCKKGGESISQKQQTIQYEKLKNIIAVAIEEGIRNFNYGRRADGSNIFWKVYRVYNGIWANQNKNKYKRI